MRQCPTLSGDDHPLIAHSIQVELCMERQREFYHKCHRCEFRGKAAEFALPSGSGARVIEVEGPGQAEPAVIVPRAEKPGSTAAAAAKAGSGGAPVKSQQGTGSPSSAGSG